MSRDWFWGGPDKTTSRRNDDPEPRGMVKMGSFQTEAQAKGYANEGDVIRIVTVDDRLRWEVWEPYAPFNAPTRRTAGQMADDAIGLFLEYRDEHGKTEAEARATVVCEFIDAALFEAQARKEGR